MHLLAVAPCLFVFVSFQDLTHTDLTRPLGERFPHRRGSPVSFLPLVAHRPEALVAVASWLVAVPSVPVAYPFVFVPAPERSTAVRKPAPHPKLLS